MQHNNNNDETDHDTDSDGDTDSETVVNSDNEDDINLSYQRLLELEEATKILAAYCITCKSQTPNFFCHAGCEDQYNAIHKTSEPVEDDIAESKN